MIFNAILYYWLITSERTSMIWNCLKGRTATPRQYSLIYIEYIYIDCLFRGTHARTYECLSLLHVERNAHCLYIFNGLKLYPHDLTIYEWVYYENDNLFLIMQDNSRTPGCGEILQDSRNIPFSYYEANMKKPLLQFGTTPLRKCIGTAHVVPVPIYIYIYIYIWLILYIIEFFLRWINAIRFILCRVALSYEINHQGPF